jgi:uncharacterized protein (TIGR00288 family)
LREEELKIAVFVDFDNIEIGVKKTLNRHFDIGTVLEAIKERGEVVTKIAYGNWKQAENYSREMTEHAVQMVQRNTTPGGDKNGADINLALDALEMAFTRDHINAFVIVGGDSDFIALVEKLKQYDKKIFIVGGRAFTSVILQKNCHEFIAYEHLIGLQSGARKAAGREQGSVRTGVEKAMPLVRRALKVLSDREVSPQLGLLKSTLLQLDSTFSERDYGTGSFREFIQKLAKAGLVSLKQVDRSLLVELKDGEPPAPPAAVPAVEAPERVPGPKEQPASSTESEAAMRNIQAAFQGAKREVRWPMYLRNVKQFLKSADASFDERRLGFSGMRELVREAQRAGLFRMERDRQGVLRVFPGERLAEPAAGAPGSEPPPVETEPAPIGGEHLLPEPPAFIDESGEVRPEVEAQPPAPGAEATPQSAPELEPPPSKPKRSRAGSTRSRTGRKASPRTSRKAAPAE